MKTGHFKTGHRLFVLGLILISSLALVACGSESPVGPSNSATIEGFVNPASGASALSQHATANSAQRAGITISIMANTWWFRCSQVRIQTPSASATHMAAISTSDSSARPAKVSR